MVSDQLEVVVDSLNNFPDWGVQFGVFILSIYFLEFKLHKRLRGFCIQSTQYKLNLNLLPYCVFAYCHSVTVVEASTECKWYCCLLQ